MLLTNEKWIMFQGQLTHSKQSANLIIIEINKKDKYKIHSRTLKHVTVS